MSLLTSQMTPKMSTAYSGLSALIQAATSQLSDLAETSSPEINTPEGSPPFRSNPTTPTLEGAHFYLDGTSSWHRNGVGAATVTPVLTSFEGERLGISAKLLFPEVLMLLLKNPLNEDIVTFLPDGKYFAVRRLDFAKKLLRKHFELIAFEAFLEEARGWGFVRVNGNTDGNRNGTSNTNNGDCNESCKHNSSTTNDDIYVFRHPHFEKNQPINMGKMRCRSKAKTRIALKQNANNEVNNFKRQLPQSTDNIDFQDNRQRLRIESNSSSVDADPFVLSGISCDQPVQLRRRSSLELRGVAQAITASKLQLKSSKAIIREEDSDNQDSPILYDADDTVYPRNGLDHTSHKQERRQSTASSLVDGGVETATQNIVTDAIEALLFDEGHTRETYNRHEKELSISSLPGVVPISKQLFSADDNSNTTACKATSDNDEANGGKSKKSNSRARKEIRNKNPELSSTSSSSSWVVHAAIESLEDASRNNVSNASACSFSSNSDLQIVIPNNLVAVQQQRKSTDRSMVVSPARLEAAAALVSQSRSDGRKE